jgi:hypothetical protein
VDVRGAGAVVTGATRGLVCVAGGCGGWVAAARKLAI